MGGELGEINLNVSDPGSNLQRRGSAEILCMTSRTPQIGHGIAVQLFWSIQIQGDGSHPLMAIILLRWSHLMAIHSMCAEAVEP